MKDSSDLEFEELAFDQMVNRGGDTVELPMPRRIFLLLGVSSLLIGLLVISRIGFLNIVRGEAYDERATANAFKEINSPSRRGIIVDRYGKVLASNQSAFSVFLNVAELLKSGKLDETIEALGNTLSLDAEEIKKRARSIDLEAESSIAVVRDISPSEIIAVRGLNLPGVEVEDDYIRIYPDPKVFAHVIGYTGFSEEGSSIIGKTGLEAYYNDRLRGKDGKLIYYRDAHGKIYEKKSFVEPTTGETLRTTIDAELQTYFYNRLQVGLEVLGKKSGVGLALNPQTGEVLSLVSIPSFDNNVFIDRRKGSERGKLLTDPGRALFNRAVSGAYNPGSTIKPLVAIGGLHEKLIDADTQVFSSGSIEVPNPYAPDHPTKFLDWKPHGLVNLASALARSSNIFFYAAGGGLSAEQTKVKAVQGLGILKLKTYWEKFGFGKKANIDLPSENSGFLPDPTSKEKRTGQIWRIGDTYNVSIGQGDLLVTPIQLIRFFGALANGGTLYQPFLVADEEKPKKVGDYSIWKDEMQKVKAGLIEAVTQGYGTAHLLADLPVSVAGKTGSAQIQNNTKVNAFFLGYAPVENPEIVLLVLVEDAREGSSNTLPIAKDVLRWYYEHRLSGPPGNE